MVRVLEEKLDKTLIFKLMKGFSDNLGVLNKILMV
jgi:hypothetical protein